MRKKVWLVILFVALLVGAGILGRYFLGSVEQVRKGLKDVSVDLSLEGVTLRQGKDGRLLWTLNATSADYQKDEGFVLLSNPKILYFQDDKPEPLYVEGDHGKVDQKNDQAFIWSNVTVRYQDALLTAARLHYDGSKRLLMFDDDVVMVRGDMRLMADAAELDLKDENLLARGNVRARIIARSSF